MGKALNDKIFRDWVEFLVSEVKGRNLDNKVNPFFNEDFIYQFRDYIVYEVKKELGQDDIQTYNWRKTYKDLQTYFAYEEPISAVYVDAYLENKEFILNEVRKELGMASEDPDSLNKKYLGQILTNILSNTDPQLLSNLFAYLENKEFILGELKQYLGIATEDHTFDTELSILVRSGFDKLFDMLGSDWLYSNGLEKAFYNEIFGKNPIHFLRMTTIGKEWLYLYVKLSFDPPTASTLTYLKERLNELERYLVNENLGDWIYGEQKHAGSETSWY